MAVMEDKGVWLVSDNFSNRVNSVPVLFGILSFGVAVMREGSTRETFCVKISDSNKTDC